MFRPINKKNSVGLAIEVYENKLNEFPVLSLSDSVGKRNFLPLFGLSKFLQRRGVWVGVLVS